MLHRIMSSRMDHCKGLGLHQTVTKEEIKIAFKKLLFQFYLEKQPLKTYNMCTEIASCMFRNLGPSGHPSKLLVIATPTSNSKINCATTLYLVMKYKPTKSQPMI